MVVLYDYDWFLVVLCDSCRFLVLFMVLDVSCGSRWISVVLCGSSWFLEVIDGSCWFYVFLGGS